MANETRISVTYTTGQDLRVSLKDYASGNYPAMAFTPLDANPSDVYTLTEIGASGVYTNSAIPGGTCKVWVWNSGTTSWDEITTYSDTHHPDSNLGVLLEGAVAGAALDASNVYQVGYTPTTAADFNVTPDNPGDALDELAGRLEDIDGAAADGSDVSLDVTTDSDFDFMGGAPATLLAFADGVGEFITDTFPTGGAAPGGLGYENTQKLHIWLKWEDNSGGSITIWTVKWRARLASATAFTKNEIYTGAADTVQVMANRAAIPYEVIQEATSATSGVEIDFIVATRYLADDALIEADYSTVSTAVVTFPTLNLVMHGEWTGAVSVCSTTTGASEAVSVQVPNLFPESATDPPTLRTERYTVPSGLNSHTYTEIMVECGVLPTSDVTLALRDSTGSSVGSVTIDSTTGQLTATTINVSVAAGNDLWIYTTNAYNMGDVRIWLRRTIG